MIEFGVLLGRPGEDEKHSALRAIAFVSVLAVDARLN
jgi:hypothetical protein